MKMRKTLLIVLTFFSCFVVSAQKRNIKGVVLDAEYKTPVPFAAVFVENSRYGTVANNLGEFSFSAPDSLSRSNLIVSAQDFQLMRLPLELLSAPRIEILLVRDVDRTYSGVLHKSVAYVLKDWLPLGNESTNKFDFGRLQTIPTYNPIEGLRLRGGVASNSRLSPHFFVKGYGAYGFRDEKFKYRGEAIYSFKRKVYHDEEFPRNNLRLIYENDLYSPGEMHPRRQNDLLLVAFRRSKNESTYRKFAEINYEKDYANGLGHVFWFRKSQLTPQGSLSFAPVTNDAALKVNEPIDNSEMGVSLRFVGKEAYLQQKRERILLNYDMPLIILSHSMGMKGVAGGDYNYHKTELVLQKRFILRDLAHLDLSGEFSKIWNSVPFPLLLYPNQRIRNNIESPSFYLGRSLEFAADEQYALRATFVGDDLLFAKVPLLNMVQVRELLSFRASYGKLSDKNIPTIQNGLPIFPEVTHDYNGIPYIEGSIGITGLLGLLRVEYVHRFTHRDVHNAVKGAIRIDISI